jgi:hypothetical protein
LKALNVNAVTTQQPSTSHDIFHTTLPAAMEWLLSFPDEILAAILTNWIGLEDLATLDTAHSNHNKRSALLNVLGRVVTLDTANASALYERHPISEKKIRINLLMRWALLRHVGVNCLFISTAFEVDNCRAESYLRARCDQISEVCYDSRVDTTPNWEAAFVLICEHCPKLQHITCARNFSTAAFRRIAATSPSLTSITIGASITDTDLLVLAEGCKELTAVSAEIDVSLSDQLTEEGWDGFLTLRGPTLTSLVAPFSVLTDRAYLSIAAHCHQLRILQVSWVCTDEEVMLQIAEGCPLLQAVDLSSNPNVKASVIRAFTRSGHLKELKTCANDSSDAEEAVICAIRRNPMLHKLSLQMVSLQRAMEQIATCGAKLTELELIWWSQLPPVASTEPQLVAIAKGCPQLRSLHLRNRVWGTSSGVVTDSVLGAFATHCPQLAVLCLENCDQISDIGVTELACRCTWLRRLLFTSAGVTIAGMEAIGAQCRHIETVALPRNRALVAEVRVERVFARRVHVTSDDRGW